MKGLPMRLSRLNFLCAAIATLGLAGCSEVGGDVGGDPARQIGANPYLPEPREYLLPPMHIARAIGWSKGETPSVPHGMQVHALATGLEHPRFVHVLPNGDVLVVEANGPKAPTNRPKDIIMVWVQNYAGTHAKGGNHITLLRDIGPDGAAKTRTVFLDHLNSPFGVALVGHDFYVANTGALIRFPYEDGQTSITAPGTKLTDLPGGPIDHHWTKSLVASPDGTKLYVGVGSNSNIWRTVWWPSTNALPSGKSTARPARIASLRAARGTRPDCNSSRKPASFGRSPMSATRSAPTSFRII